MALLDPVRSEDGYLPIGGYALLGDGRSCALVGADGAIDWWALPVMDDDPVFGALLDPRRGGTLRLRPAATSRVERRYVGDGGVLETVHRTDTGAVRVTDALTLSDGTLLPWVELARRVEGVEGEVDMEWEIVPGDRFATTAPWARTVGGVPLITTGGQRLALVIEGAGEPGEVPGGFRGRFTARPGADALLAVAATDEEPSPVPSPDRIRRRIATTAENWSRWRGLLQDDGPWRDAVLRSAIVLRQLTLTGTGALQAAATTSLPEAVGGTRNYDYRFCWVRDTGFALDAMTAVGLQDEVHGTLSYLLDAVGGTAPDVRVLYSMRGGTVGGGTRTVPLWRGYRGSAPVQRGNGAATQRQLGTYGDLLGAVARYCEAGNVLDGRSARLVAGIADEVCDQWRLDDAGLWELGSFRPYTISKMGCWAALDRSLRLARDGQVPDEGAPRWAATAEEIRRYVDRECWSSRAGAYTFHAGGEDLDCATLLAARTGFCERGDPRLASTIDAIRDRLGAGGPLLYRYSGMRGREGAFIACSFWLVEALAHVGRRDEAREVMDGAVAQANDLGLLSEEVDPEGGALLGNMPQALSHLALISAAASLR